MLLKIWILLSVSGVLKLYKNSIVYASTEDTKEVPPSIKLPDFKLTEGYNAEFLEQFTEDWKGRWITSSALRKEDGNKSFYYVGQWDVEEPRVFKGMNGDKGLVLKTVAAHHAISAKFKNVLDNKGKTLVVQYEVKLQNDLECGGAYLKLVTESPDDILHKEFSDKTPYTIMFGPDKCGATNKVHFIFRHKNPITGNYEEKHLKSPPIVQDSRLTTLYTLIVRHDQTFEIRINNKVTKKGSLLLDFDPPVNPPKDIVDPNDKKPANWVDDAMIVDLSAKKPDDWDENEPFQIPDPDAVKPTNWYEDEPLMIKDPSVQKPEEWDDEEDGEFIPPMIQNPICIEAAGCGPFKPMKNNPKYKGKWKPPLINNPEYIGEWVPRNIPNPDYFEDLNPSNFEKLVGIGFELWTMQNDILFDNIYIGHSVEDAEKFAKATFEVKYKYEVAQEKKQSQKYETPAKTGTLSDTILKESYFELAMEKFYLFVDLVKNDPISAFKAMPGTASTIGALFVTIIALLYGLVTLVFSSNNNSSIKAKRVEPKTTKEPSKSNEDSDADVSSDGANDSIEQDASTSAKKRVSKRTE